MRPDAQRPSGEGVVFIRTKEDGVVHAAYRPHLPWTLCEMFDNAIGDSEVLRDSDRVTCLWCLRCP